MAVTGLAAANNLNDIIDIEQAWDNIGSNISATVFVPTGTLDLNFAENKSLIDNITGSGLISFTRASSGTFIGSDGLIQAAASGVPRFDHDPTTGESLGLLVEEPRTNLVRYSQDITNAAWDKNNTTATKEAISGPAGTIEYDKITLGTFTNSSGQVLMAITASPGTVYSNSVYVKQGTCRYVHLIQQYSNSSRTGAYFDLQTGTFLTGGGLAASSTRIQALANGWYRIQLTVTDVGPGGSASFILSPMTIPNPVVNGSGGREYNGNGEFIYAYGAQIEEGTFSTSYIPTLDSTVTRSEDIATIQGDNFGTVKNLILYPEKFVNGFGWLNGATAVTENAILSPFGQLTADALLETVANTEHILYPEIFLGVTSAQTFSVFVKANGRNNVSLRVFITNNNWVSRVFNLTGAGSITQSSTGASADFTISGQAITQYDNGWYRISITTAQPSARLMYFSIDLCTVSTPTMQFSSGTESYAGDVTKGIYVWGAQREINSAPTEYSAHVAASNWFNADTGTFFAKGFIKNAPGDVTGRCFLSVGTIGLPSINNGLAVIGRYPAANFVAIQAALESDVTGREVGIEIPSFPAEVTIAGAFSDGRSVMAGNGILSPAITGKTLAKNVDFMRIGANRDGSFCVNFTISRITFWPTILTDITLKSVSNAATLDDVSYSFSIKGRDVFALKNVNNVSIRDFVFIKGLTAGVQPRLDAASRDTASGVVSRNGAMPKIAPTTTGDYFFSSGLTLSGVSCQINGTNAHSIATSPFSGPTATTPLLFAGLRPQANLRISDAMASGTVTSPELAIPIETNNFLLFMKAGQG
jgi:hypothetical protein